jgi:hypothetical protein
MVDELDSGSLAASSRVTNRDVAEPRDVGFPALQRPEEQRPVLQDLGSRRLRDRVGFRDQPLGPPELSAHSHSFGQDVQGNRQHGEGAQAASQLDAAAGDGHAAFVIPHDHGSYRRQPPPAEYFLDGRAFVAEASRRSLQERRRRSAPVCQEPGKSL